MTQPETSANPASPSVVTLEEALLNVVGETARITTGHGRCRPAGRVAVDLRLHPACKS
jgi:hypothetical protein